MYSGGGVKVPPCHGSGTGVGLGGLGSGVVPGLGAPQMAQHTSEERTVAAQFSQEVSSKSRSSGFSALVFSCGLSGVCLRSTSSASRACGWVFSLRLASALAKFKLGAHFALVSASARALFLRGSVVALDPGFLFGLSAFLLEAFLGSVVLVFA